LVVFLEISVTLNFDMTLIFYLAAMKDFIVDVIMML